MITIVFLIILLSFIALIVILLHFSLVIYLHVGRDGFDIKAKYLGFTLYPRPAKKARKRRERKKTGEEDKSADDGGEELFDDDLEDELDEPQTEESTISEEKDETKEQEPDEFSEEKTEVEPQQTNDDEPAQAAKESEPTAAENKKSLFSKKDKKEKKTKDVKTGKKKSKLKELKEKYDMIKPYIPKGWKYLKKLLKAIRIKIDDAEIAVGREDAHEAAIYYGIIQATLANTLSTLSEMFTVKVRKLDVNCVFNENVIDAKADISVRTRPSTLIAIAVCTAVNFAVIYLKNRKKGNNKDTDEKNETSDKSSLSVARSVGKGS
ncbi:MAG: DUF2953 domain-containing protein [Oscillospiraceae bacterium]